VNPLARFTRTTTFRTILPFPNYGKYKYELDIARFERIA